MTAETPKRENPPITTGCCDAQWSGLAAAHCAACHHTFTSAGGFDRHRRGGNCLNPADIGMVSADRKWPGWSMPGSWNGPDEAAS